MAIQIGRIASDLDSEKRTRTETSRMLLEELKGLRSDMQKNFHGDNENPGIIIRLDRIERTNVSALVAKMESHEKKDEEQFKNVSQKFMDVTGQINKLATEDATTQSYVKGARNVLSGIVIIIGLALAALQLILK